MEVETNMVPAGAGWPNDQSEDPTVHGGSYESDRKVVRSRSHSFADGPEHSGGHHSWGRQNHSFLKAEVLITKEESCPSGRRPRSG